MAAMNNIQVERGLRSTRIQRRSDSSVHDEVSPFEMVEFSGRNFELDFHRLESFDDVRVINNPELSPKSSYTAIGHNEGLEPASSAFEVPSDEIAILSISSSGTKSSPPSDQPGANLRNIQYSTNSDRIDEWCLSSHFFNGLRRNVSQPNDSTTQGFPVSSFREMELHTSAKLKKLTNSQRIAVQQLSRDFYPILRTCRRTKSRGPLLIYRQERLYDDIPSFFPQRDSIFRYYSLPFEFDRFSDVDIESSSPSRLADDNFREPSNRSSSTASSSVENRSWFGWTLLSRFLDREW
ncbi:hypothetical protein SEUBUCD646_0J00360 [Saccharomyces eubayanus]|uniref:ATG36-like protein n=1 Tax=Saccharomyces eubayanus TaxID=1080349 RepID=A0ABN8VF89_SACEU|nr:hypothetical protein SEUBUCD650_0J00370 [Saccharomyces eubayanus]CAI1517588.1 hypothetical protein SEUBUCD646_0J00360 [Saccharomyces eubayanus]